MRVFGWSTGKGGVHWYRIREPLRGLRLQGHQTDQGIAMFNGQEMHNWDVLLAHGVHQPIPSQGWRRLAELGRHLLVYDIDDDHWNWHPDTSQARYWTEDRLFGVEENLIAADLVTTPSETFAGVLRQLNRRVAVVPNTVPRWLTRIGPSPRQLSWKAPFVVGWEGAPHHIDDLRLIWGPLVRFMLRHPEAQFWAWGPASFDELPGALEGRVRIFPWAKDVPTYYRSLDMDVALAPLEPTAFNETKSAIRVQEHSALGIPIIASPGPAYHGYLAPGVNGLFATSEEDWEDALEELHGNHRLRQDMRVAGRKLAESWTTEAQAPMLERVYEEAREHAGRGRQVRVGG
jgi:glycosyltransferase involved in cell wall biosynthesis